MRLLRWFQSNILLTLCKFRRERKPGWLQNARTLFIGTRDLLPLASTCRCSRTIEWNSAFAGSILEPLTQLSSSSPSSRYPKWWKAENSSLPMTISGQKKLNPCPSGERAATLEKMVLTRSPKKRWQSLPNSAVEANVFFSRDENWRVPPRNALLQLPPSMIDSGACTPPTSLSRANCYSASLFVANNTQIGRAPRMPDNHNRHAQSPIRWNCVQPQ